MVCLNRVFSSLPTIWYTMQMEEMDPADFVDNKIPKHTGNGNVSISKRSESCPPNR